MGKKKEVTPEEFMSYNARMLAMGYTLKSKKDMSDMFRRIWLELTNGESEHKREEGHECSARGLTAHVWNTWISADQKIRDKDYGWVVISKGDKGKYFAKPFLRTENFLENLATYAEIILAKIRNRPLCPTCGRYMDIHSGIGKPTYWVCRDYGHFKTEDWDLGLSDEQKKFLQKRRKDTARYNKQRDQEGKPRRGTALRKRSGKWIVNRPENMI